MKIYFGQIYIQPGISFPFDFPFQSFLSEEITKIVNPSIKFINLHGEDYNLMFRISAKKELAINEIVGPTIYKKDKDVEYSIFVPFTPIMQQSEPNRSALEHLFEGVYYVLGEYNIDVSKLKFEQKRLINKIMLSPEMFEPDSADLQSVPASIRKNK